MDELRIIASLRALLDDAGHAIKDGNRQKATDYLQDVKQSIETLQGVLRLPESCRAGLEEIWQ